MNFRKRGSAEAWVRVLLWGVLGLSAGFCSGFMPGAMAQTGTLQFGSRAYLAKESVPAAKILVKRVSGSAGTLTVDFRTVEDSGVGGTATPDLDYYPTNGTLTFSPGLTSKSFYVPLINDIVHEGNETIILELSNVSEGGVLGDPANATLTIMDNDVCAYTLDPSTRTADEVGGLASFQVITLDGCEWVAQESDSWIGIAGASSGSGNGEVHYSYDPLPEGVSTRTATIRVAGKTFTLTQRKPPADLQPPTVTIRTPAQGSRQTNTEITVTGSAADNVGVTAVEVILDNDNGSVTNSATGTTSWSGTVAGLIPGTNTIRILAHDDAGFIGTASRSVLFVEVSPLALSKVGNGTVSPLANGQLLDVGQRYQLVARPASGNFFRNWSLNGGDGPADNPLSFEMAADLSLQANFIPTPFPPFIGTYNGLFYEAAEIHHESSGFLSLRLGPLGTFSARLIVGGQRLSFSGRFGLDGTASNSIKRATAPAVTVLLNLDLTGGIDGITGLVSNGTWQADLQAYRSPFHAVSNPAPQAGRYTASIPGDTSQADTQPGGDGFGTLMIGVDGTANLAATMADGTRLTHKATLSQNGWYPIYVPLYAGHGAVICWAFFGDEADSDFSGPLTWIKPADERAKFYPAGFGVHPTFAASRYYAPTNVDQRVIALTDGQLQFGAGNLAEDFANPITVAADGKVTNLGTNRLVVTLQKSTGLFTGSVTPPGATVRLPFRGAINQKSTVGSGYFLGTSQSGRALLGE